MLLITRGLLLFFLLLALGCSQTDSVNDMLENYTERAAQILDVDADISMPARPYSYPRRRLRYIDIATVDISLLDLLGVYDCRLQPLVAQRNSSLGKVMHASSRLVYETNVLMALDECIAALEDEKADPELILKLQTKYSEKQQHYPKEVWNAIWASKEMEHLFSFSNGVIPIDEDDQADFSSFVDFRNGMSRFARLLDGNVLSKRQFLPDDEFDAFYSYGYYNALYGQLILSANNLQHYLTQTTEIITRRLDARPVCYNRKPSTRAKRVQSFFFAIYVGQVQPYLSQIHQLRQQVMPAMEGLIEQQHPVMPAGFKPFYEKYLDDKNSVGFWNHFDAVVDQHTKAWKRLLGECGMMPGS